jgi:hypothetical protein
LPRIAVFSSCAAGLLALVAISSVPAIAAGPGSFGDGTTFAQSLSILALKGAGRPVPPDATAYLRGLQNSDGSWNSKSAPGGPGTGDTNSTAIALMALAAIGDHSRDAQGMAYLHSVQGADGGFPFAPGPGACSDPDSDALVLQALKAAGSDGRSASWSKGSENAYTQALRLQDASSGGFSYPNPDCSPPAPDSFTTSQVPAGLEGRPFPIAPAYVPGTLIPPAACPRATPALDPAVRALQYLHCNQAADGAAVDPSFDPYRAGPTEDLALGAAAAGFDPKAVLSGAGKSPYDYLAGHVRAETSNSDGSVNAGGTAKLILAVRAGDLQPSSFGGEDLVARLMSAYHAGPPGGGAAAAGTPSNTPALASGSSSTPFSSGPPAGAYLGIVLLIVAGCGLWMGALAAAQRR